MWRAYAPTLQYGAYNVCLPERTTPLIQHTHSLLFFQVRDSVSGSKTSKSHFRKEYESQLLFVRNKKRRASKFAERCQWLEKFPKGNSEPLLWNVPWQILLVTQRTILCGIMSLSTLCVKLFRKLQWWRSFKNILIN